MILYDQVCMNEVKVHEIDIPNGIVISCKMASKKYKSALDAKRNEMSYAEESRKRRLIHEELEEVKQSKTELEQSVMLAEYSRKIETWNDCSFI